MCVCVCVWDDTSMNKYISFVVRLGKYVHAKETQYTLQNNILKMPILERSSIYVYTTVIAITRNLQLAISMCEIVINIYLNQLSH